MIPPTASPIHSTSAWGSDVVRSAREAFAGKPVLVTGASGFIGRRLRDALIELGADVVALRRAASPAPSRGRSVVAEYADAASLERIVGEGVVDDESVEGAAGEPGSDADAGDAAAVAFELPAAGGAVVAGEILFAQLAFVFRGDIDGDGALKDSLGLVGKIFFEYFFDISHGVLVVLPDDVVAS